MGLSSPGIGSGMDIGAIVTALVNASYQPRQVSLNVKEADIQTEISAIGSVKAAMEAFQESVQELQDIDSFDKRKTTVSDGSALAVEADSDAVAGNYSVEIQQLAQSHKVGAAAVKDKESTVGEGRLSIFVGVDEAGNPDSEAQLDIEVAADDTLEDIVNKINDADDNPGVTATIVYGEDGPQMVLSSDETGVENKLTVQATDSSGSGLSDTFGSMTELQAAKDAKLTVDGISISSASNTVSGAIAGIDLTLKEAELGKTINVEVKQDVDGAKKVVEEFVEQYNALQKTLSDLSGYDAENEKAGPLQGDSLLRGISSILRNTMGSVFGDDNTSLGQIGLKFDQYGTLEVDDDALDEALKSDMSGVANLFAEEDKGLSYLLDNALEPYTKSGGILAGRDESLTGQLDDIGDQRELLNRQMAAYESQMFDQFNAMDLVMYELNAQLAGLQNNLAGLPGMVPKN
ncbi:flagellar filament capping protein FliD [Ferrimonas senticii]|uniref:flagellar filament capping protein FliD n=1 Tax=Ferrimonas senticii TaxID=394566 RepID=UPI000422AF65|nr:flagellar filament capping protein FliD [Ferrimonas senticii]